MSAPDFSKSKMPPWNFSPEFIAEHPELHHYTDRFGLEGIWNSGTLWATHFSNLSDSKETQILREPLEFLLLESYKKIVEKKMRTSSQFRRYVANGGGSTTIAHDAIKNFVDALYEIAFLSADGGMSEPYITSFCSHSKDNQYEQDNGILSQWRGYGGSGKFSLVFDTALLEHLLQKEWYAQH